MIRPHISVTNAASGKKSNVYIQEQPVSQAPAMFDEIKELRERLAESAKMLRRGQIACERQGWEKGESTEAWYFSAGQLAGLIENLLEPKS